MATVVQHIEAADAVICANIATLPSQRNLLSQNVLAQLRNLVEAQPSPKLPAWSRLSP